MGSAPKAPQQQGEKEKKTSFWKTLPGVLTAVATLITALTGLMVALCQMHILICTAQVNGGGGGSSGGGASSGSASGAVVATSGLKATADGILYEILSGELKPYSPTESMLALDVKITCGDQGVSFSDSLFGLSADDVVLSPQETFSNQWVDPYRSWKEKVRFIVRNDAKTLKLVVGRAATGRTAEIPLAKEQLKKNSN